MLTARLTGILARGWRRSPAVNATNKKIARRINIKKKNVTGSICWGGYKLGHGAFTRVLIFLPRVKHTGKVWLAVEKRSIFFWDSPYASCWWI